MQAVLKAQINKTDRNDARGIAQMMRVGLYRPVPFALIQVQGFSAALAGTVFLPLTIIMGALSRWSGGLLDRFGAKWLLVVGPTIAAFGFGLLALPIGGESYWAFLVPMTILGLGRGGKRGAAHDHGD